MTAVPMQLLRVVLGLLAMFFAFFLGRVATRLYLQHQPMAKAITWVLRMCVAVGAILWTGGLDRIAIVLVCLIALTLAGGVYVEMRPRKVEEVHLFRED